MNQSEIAQPFISGLPSRIPDTPQRQELERKRGIRELVFGAQDGVLTTMGLVTGLNAAANERATLVIAGLLALCVGALSMGVGEYLGAKSEQEVVRSAIDLERREMLQKPAEEILEQIGYYRLKGFTEEEASMIVNRLVQNHEIWLHEMVRDEFGIDPRVADENVVYPAFKMAGSFAIGAFMPILPFMFTLPVMPTLALSLVLAAFVLFSIGWISGVLSDRSPFFKALEIVGFGAGVFAFSYAVGRFIPALLGHAIPPGAI